MAAARERRRFEEAQHHKKEPRTVAAVGAMSTKEQSLDN
jgi:hypothetical protein